jgi:hypothetical protein
MILAAGLFVLTRVYILFVFEPKISDVGAVYFVDTVKAHDDHLVPYQENLPIVYPPLAWWVIYAPRLFDSHPLTDPSDLRQLKLVRDSYLLGFRSEMFVCDVLSLLLLWLIVKKQSPGLVGWAALTYTITTAVFGHLLYDRLDIGLTLLFLLWAFCWIKSLANESRSIGWAAVAYGLLGLGISYKLIPVIVIPFLLLADWHASRRAVRLLSGTIALSAAAIFPFLIQYLISDPAVFDLFKFHSERGIQIESLYSTFMMFGSLAGWEVFVLNTHGAFNLAGDLSKLMITLSNVLLLLFLASIWFWLFFRPSELQRSNGYRAVCFTVVGSVILSKVLSPQYFIWALPMSLLLAAELFPPSRTKPWILTVLWVLVAVLSTWLFPYHYFSKPDAPGLVSSNPLEAKTLYLLPCIVLAVRNLIYLAMVVWLGVALFRIRAEPTSQHNS